MCGCVHVCACLCASVCVCDLSLSAFFLTYFSPDPPLLRLRNPISLALPTQASLSLSPSFVREASKDAGPFPSLRMHPHMHTHTHPPTHTPSHTRLPPGQERAAEQGRPGGAAVEIHSREYRRRPRYVLPPSPPPTTAPSTPPIASSSLPHFASRIVPRTHTPEPAHTNTNTKTNHRTHSHACPTTHTRLRTHACISTHAHTHTYSSTHPRIYFAHPPNRASGEGNQEPGVDSHRHGPQGMCGPV